jgi:hypothetical protein
VVFSARFVLTLPWYVGLSYWRQFRFREGREHELLVPPGPDGRPGEQLLVPSRPLHRPKVVKGSRNDFGVMLDGYGSSMTAVCFGRVDERGEPERSAHDTLRSFWERGWAELSPMTVESIGDEDAYRYHAVLPRTRLTEWKFAHAGWLYGVGVFSRAPDPVVTSMRARHALDTWRWLDASPSAG